MPPPPIVLATAMLILLGSPRLAVCREDIWIDVHCEEILKPDYCNFTSLSSVRVDELERCAPARLEISARNYFLGAAGRKTTYKDNKDAFDRIRILPKMLRDVSNSNLETSVLGRRVDFPIGLSPVALHKLAHPEGEKATAEGLSGMRTVMMVSSLATTRLEEVAETVKAGGGSVQLWMQTYIFLNRSLTVDLVRRAERSGFKAVVLTCDSPVDAKVSCDARNTVRFPEGVQPENLDRSTLAFDASTNFKDIRWLKKVTKLPIVAKGLLSGDDARRAVLAGASAVLVSNHGGRQMDGAPATIDALPGVVRGLRGVFPPPEVYLDGGVRSGHDVFKALARGARMVFVGRPQIWGLAYGGAAGVRSVVTNLRRDLNETMMLAGVSKLSDINPNLLLPTERQRSPLLPVSSSSVAAGGKTTQESSMSVDYEEENL